MAGETDNSVSWHSDHPVVKASDYDRKCEQYYLPHWAIQTNGWHFQSSVYYSGLASRQGQGLG